MSQPPETPPEMLITRVLHQRLKDEDCLRPGDRESVAYRISELMVAAKALYTDVLPRLTRELPVTEPLPLEEELAGLRMALLHIRDLVADFDEAFFEAMHHQREEDGTGPLLPPDDLEEEE